MNLISVWGQSKWFNLINSDRKLLLGLFLALLQALTSIALLATSAWLITRAAEQPPIMYLSIAVVGVRAFAISKATLRYAERIFTHDAVFSSLGRDKQNLFDALIPVLPFGLPGHSRGEILTSLVTDLETVKDKNLRVYPVLWQVAAAIISSSVLIAWLLPSALLLTEICWILALSASWWFSSVSSKSLELVASQVKADYSDASLDYLEKIDLVEAFELGDSRRHHLSQLSRDSVWFSVKSWITQGLSQATILIGAAAAVATVYLVGYQSFINGDLSRVQLAVILLAQLAFLDVYLGLPGAVTAWHRARAASRRVESIAPGFEKVLQTPGYSGSTEKFESLQFGGNVKVKYPNSQVLTLITEHAVLDRSSIVGIRGPSGIGKSSLALSLVGLVELRSGLQINGLPAEEVDLAVRRSWFGYLEQSPHMFASSLRTNLRVANQNATDEELFVALKKVDLWKAFESRGGLDVELGDFGNQVSGGESARISIARGLLSDFPVLILDEPTSNVHADLGLEIVRGLIDTVRAQQRALVIISHDEEVLALCDKVVNVTR
jgi:ATP-binding cassette subfamily C protein CydC